MTGRYRRLKERVKGSLAYWIGLARSEFAADLSRFMEQEPRVTRAELARRIGSSPAYVTKVLNDSAGNFTLETMAKLARAVDAQLHIRLAREGQLLTVDDGAETEVVTIALPPMETAAQHWQRTELHDAWWGTEGGPRGESALPN